MLSLVRLARLFSGRVQALADMPEKFPVQEQVEDEQGSEDQTCIVMHRDPRVPGNSHPWYPAAAASPGLRAGKCRAPSLKQATE
jgi:hypothetical protein